MKNIRLGDQKNDILNDEMQYIMKIVKSLKDSNLLLKGVSETMKN